MFFQALNRAVAATSAALLLTFTFALAQGIEPTLKVDRPRAAQRQNNRVTPEIRLDRAEAFGRINSQSGARASRSDEPKDRKRNRVRVNSVSGFARFRQAASVTALQSFGTGGGDIFEAEPNGQIAQGVSLPVNIFGEISFDGDVDFFAFQGLAAQQITIEAFAARLRGSELIPDIGLFTANGLPIDSSFGDEDNDPIIRYTPSQDEILIVGIADIDDFGDRDFDYILNITRGIDVEEVEPNGSRAQNIPDLPVTIFGEIDGRSDVDFYSFVASAGQTLILDVDADVFGSRLDAEINLSDPQSGVEFFYNDQFDGDDPRFNIVLPYTGRYVIGIGSFDNNSSGFYRLNATLVSGAGAPQLTRVTRIAKKTLEVVGTGFTVGTVVEVNGVARKTTVINSGTLHAKVKAKAGNVVTVSNPPDDRRSNPLIVQ
jgi:hypothetical protein